MDELLPTNPEIGETIEKLQEISPDGAEYISVILDLMKDFDISSYQENPEKLIHVIDNGLQDDINELIFEQSDSAIDEEKKKQLNKLLQELFEHLQNKPVYYWAFQKLFEHFSITEPEKSAAEEENTRYQIPNIMLDYNEAIGLMIGCGLEKVSGKGSGSHSVWKDPQNQMEGFTTITFRGKKWLKKLVRELSIHSLPQSRIFLGLDKQKISYRIINQ